MTLDIQSQLSTLFSDYFGEFPSSIEPLPLSGSSRQYWRMKSVSQQCIGSYNADTKENEAFFAFSSQLKQSGVKVPEVYCIHENRQLYLQQDLGDLSLFAYLSSMRSSDDHFPAELTNIYKRVISQLVKLQLKAPEHIDWNYCYPRSAFDTQSMMWDLNYCKYYFFKLAQIPFDEQALENDFQQFCKYLLTANQNYFLYRDFQSRNIILSNNDIYFIDYQGGRKGALHYDLASLLYDAKAEIPQNIREELLDFYMDELEKQLPIDREEFVKQFYAYVYIRILQAMGAYGFRGFYERKSHFLKSIPLAVQNISYLLKQVGLPVAMPELEKILKQLSHSHVLQTIAQKEHTLNILVTSFAYKNGYPTDPSPNGGGFVFDCRAVHNPGRYEQYKQLTGNDPEVIQFIEENTDMDVFLQQAFTLVDYNIKNYLKRGFTHLSVSFGCTGGQHRSVYAANQMAQYLSKKHPVNVQLQHREQDKK